MRLLAPHACLALLCALVPGIAGAESDDPCRWATEYEPPVLFGMGEVMPTDGFVALERWDQEFTDVRFVSATGVEVAAPPMFGPDTASTYALFQPAEPLEAGAYELVFLHEPLCFEPREVRIPIAVAGVAEPIDVMPDIAALDVRLYDHSLLVIDVELEPPPGLETAWTAVEGDFPEDASIPDVLLAPWESGPISITRSIDDEDVETVCARAMFLDDAGAPSPIAERCTMDIQHLAAVGPDHFSCNVGTGSRPGALGLAILLGLLGWRRANGHRARYTNATER